MSRSLLFGSTAALEDELANQMSFPAIRERAWPDNNRDVYRRSDTLVRQEVKVMGTTFMEC